MKYLLKTRGTDKIPDYLQIRDEEFQLIVHCTERNAERVFEKHNIHFAKEDIFEFIKEMPFGKLTKLEEKN